MSSSTAKYQPRSKGRFASKSKAEDKSKTSQKDASAPGHSFTQSLISFNKGTSSDSKATKSDVSSFIVLKVTNPVVYLKNWWNKVIANEGMDFRFHVRPLTALTLSIAIAGMSFGVGRIALPENSPLAKVFPWFVVKAQEDPWKDVAYTGILDFAQYTKKYYLSTSDHDAILLNAPENVLLNKLIGKRILAIGKINKDTGLFVVSEASDLEILPTNVTPVPVVNEASGSAK